jgi:hypothetical protein
MASKLNAAESVGLDGGEVTDIAEMLFVSGCVKD